MKRLLACLVVVWVLGSNVFGEVKVVEHRSVGVGKTRMSAIKDALYQAVAQVKGVEVSSADYKVEIDSASIDVERSETSKSVNVDSVSIEAAGDTTKTRTGGIVKGYDIIEEKTRDDGSYEVVLNVRLYDYEKPAQSKRASIAVMPIQTLADSYTAGDYNVSGTDAAKMLADKIEIRLTKTNKMAVLDRRHIAEVLANQNFNYYMGSLEERARIGNALGSDYMFIGMIADMHITVETKNIEAVGVVSSEYEAAFGFDYRVVNAQTMQIKMADAIKIRLGNDQFNMLIDQRTQEVDYKDMLDNLMSMAAEEVVANIMEQLYPVKIAAISDSEQIVINQGQGRIFEGMVLNVVAEGEEIFDSETNESLGKTENTVAKVQVYKTMANISYAKLIEGKIADIAVDMICRPVMDEFGGYQETDNGAKSKIEITPQGGVKLPSD
jgi:hypothetical protein